MIALHYALGNHMTWVSVHGRYGHCGWCSMVCRGYMVDRHCVWCSMVGSVTWDYVQNESHSLKKMKICVLGIVSWGRFPLPPPQGERPGIEVRNDHRW